MKQGGFGEDSSLPNNRHLLSILPPGRVSHSTACTTLPGMPSRPICGKRCIVPGSHQHYLSAGAVPTQKKAHQRLQQQQSGFLARDRSRLISSLLNPTPLVYCFQQTLGTGFKTNLSHSVSAPSP